MFERDIAQKWAEKRREVPSNGNFREEFTIRPRHKIICESKEMRNTWQGLSNWLKEKQMRPYEFSFKTLLIEMVDAYDGPSRGRGRQLIESWNPQNPETLSLQEAAGAVVSADFSNITGQILYTQMMDALEEEELVFTNLVPNMPSQFIGREKIPGITGLGDQASIVPENEEFPRVGVNEDWIELPGTTKRGFIISLTKEALFSDRTGMLLEKASAVGRSLALNKEKRVIDCIIDENTTLHRYNWQGTEYATYQTSTPWDNVTASNTLADWTDIDNANQTLNGITDPNTGEPVVIGAEYLICAKELEATAMQIRNATEVEAANPGYATSSNPVVFRGASPVPMNFQIVTSRLLAERLATDSHWFYGNPRKAFVYKENWPITVTQAPANNSREFERDVVTEFKGSERGQTATIEPRYMSKSTT